MKLNWARVIALILFMISTPAMAEEYIRSFHSVIDVGTDGKLTVTETITVNVEGNRFQRGLVRDFPLYKMGDNGRRQKVDFEVLGVERDGSREDWHTESISGGIRIFTGNADRMLRHGEHTFQIDCWSRQVGAVHAKRMVDAVKAALHDRGLSLTASALVEMRVIMRRVLRDSDGITHHGVVTVQAIIEEAG